MVNFTFDRGFFFQINKDFELIITRLRLTFVLVYVCGLNLCVQVLYNVISIQDGCCWQFTKSGSKCQPVLCRESAVDVYCIDTNQTLCSQSDANLFEMTSKSRSWCSVTGLCLSRCSLKPSTKVVSLLVLYCLTKQLFICTYKS